MTTATQRAAYNYTYVEPHPSVPKSHQISTGRGGAGNATRLCPKTTTDGATATGPASRSPLIKPSSGPRHISVGRGGAGNVKDKVKQKIKVTEIDATPLNELEREERLDRFDAIESEGRIWHYGRGGSGNVLDQSKSRSGSIASGSSSRRGSVVSSRSAGSDRGGDKASRKGSFVDKMASKLRRSSDDGTN